jgi:hypothetical protein
MSYTSFRFWKCTPVISGLVQSTTTTSTMASTDVLPSNDDPSLSRRSWYDILTPFSPSALSLLPNSRRPRRYTRADAIPATANDDNGQRPTVRDYHAINSLPPQVRVPKKIHTPIKVEGKVWFANERSMFAIQNTDNPCLTVPMFSSLGIVAEYLDSTGHPCACAVQCL